jgi:hypothetical protein
MDTTRRGFVQSSLFGLLALLGLKKPQAKSALACPWPAYLTEHVHPSIRAFTLHVRKSCPYLPRGEFVLAWSAQTPDQFERVATVDLFDGLLLGEGGKCQNRHEGYLLDLTEGGIRYPSGSLFSVYEAGQVVASAGAPLMRGDTHGQATVAALEFWTFQDQRLACNYVRLLEWLHQGRRGSCFARDAVVWG